MNNYLFANIATGKLSGKRGGGIPTFTLGESNPTQIYFLDYPKPTPPYNASIPPLGDAYAFSVNTVNKNNSTLSFRAGPAIGAAIIQETSWSNLPSTVTGTFTGTYEQISGINVDVFVGTISVSGNIALSPSPTSGSVRIRLSYKRYLKSNTYIFGAPIFTKWVHLPYFASEFDISRAITSLYDGLLDVTDNQNLEELEILPFNAQSNNGANEFLINQQRYNQEVQKYNISKTSISGGGGVVQSGDYSFFYTYQGNTAITTPATLKQSERGISFSGGEFQIDTSNATAPFGKYGDLDFSSPSWESLLGSDNEKEIWIEAVLDNKVVSQGRALLRKKLST